MQNVINTARSLPQKHGTALGCLPPSFGNVDVQRHSPSANDNHPFQLMALADVQVQFGVMERKHLRSATDLVEGDGWSFRASGNIASADTLDEGCCNSVKIASDIDVGLAYFVIGTSINLTLMSGQGTLLICRYITNRDSDAQSYLLLPSGFDENQTYELIAKSGCSC